MRRIGVAAHEFLMDFRDRLTESVPVEKPTETCGHCGHEYPAVSAEERRELIAAHLKRFAGRVQRRQESS